MLSNEYLCPSGEALPLPSFPSPLAAPPLVPFSSSPLAPPLVPLAPFSSPHVSTFSGETAAELTCSKTCQFECDHLELNSANDLLISVAEIIVLSMGLLWFRKIILLVDFMADGDDTFGLVTLSHAQIYRTNFKL